MDIDTSRMDSIPAQQQQWPGLTTLLDPPADHGETSYIGRGRLEGKKALITGADSGIGRATAIAFAREGADVAIGYLEAEQSDADQVKQLIEAEGRTAVLVPKDLRTKQANQELVEAAVQGLGGLDIVVANAGYHWGRTEGLAEIGEDEMRQAVETNLYGTVWLCQAALPHLGSGSAIVITTSVQAYDPSESLMDYAATKAALNNLTVSMAADLGPKGIRVNAVAPGPIWTPLQPATKTEESVEGCGADTPLGRAGHPIEVATAYVYLASDEASYVSGSVLGVTGGKPVF
ncbi:SDR family oxidoreductase [Luteococcus sediminum]|uniref:SDR family oxidoreductase n=1 Tax=Luteococcus sp. TaxID=1969402 RepID=UPI003736736A